MEVGLNQILEAYGRIAHISHYHIFIIAVALDIVSGYIKAGVQKDLDSKVGLKGIQKHLSIVGLVFLVCPYLWLMGYGEIATFLIYSITITYAISIVENYDVIAPGTLPKSIGQFFRRTKENLDRKDWGEK
ncbi:phage holin family protein [Peptoniphilus lacydonensis]|nr:phage holin family protein [Peptoniphilus lacydonensis]MDU2116204.1 phage holin family protein [Peptoniphilus lacydonensis]MDU5377330.1 phage holin family protein [Peptoniphilus lacydonensis]MDU5436219.1 phage holin family protein [Peptoniphilus lacydonensis]MDU7302123.1 phage holin family protein [Peptoniphilus lacydonensis]